VGTSTPRPAGTVLQRRRAALAVALEPLPACSLADASRLGDIGHRPAEPVHALDEQFSLKRYDLGVRMELHPSSSSALEVVLDNNPIALALKSH
jgi:hypothetical protein